MDYKFANTLLETNRYLRLSEESRKSRLPFMQANVRAIRRVTKIPIAIHGVIHPSKCLGLYNSLLFLRQFFLENPKSGV